MQVRYSYLKQQFANCDDLWNELKKFVSTGDFTLGKHLKRFEKNFANLIGTKYAIGVNSGTDAIKLSLKALGIKQGDEVITAANTFVATVGAINELGAKIVFIDCDDSFCMNVNHLENYITSKKTSGKIVDLSNGTDKVDLVGKIVLIKGADPGFDWIFSKPIKGLITQYGGVGSHMAIRAAEFGIPAAIGCGEVLYNTLVNANCVELDCGNHNIQIEH